MVPHFAHTKLMTVVVDLQASLSSDHVWSVLLLPTPEQLLCQVPPGGARQVALPDFSDVPHLGYALVELMFVLTGVVISEGRTSSRPGIYRREA